MDGAVIKKWLKRMLEGLGRTATAAGQKAAKVLRRIYHRLSHLLIYTVKIFIRKKGSRSAAQFSFNVIFSMFPLLICVNWLVGVLHTNYDFTLQTLGRLLPADTISIIVDYLDYIAAHQSNAMLFAGLVMLITPSAAALRSLQGILCDIDNRGRSGTVWDFLLSFPFSLVFLGVIYLCMLLMFTGERLLDYLTRHFDISRVILGWNWLRFVVVFMLLSMVLYLLYRFLPFSIKRPKDVLLSKRIYPGVIFSSTTLVIVSIIFSWFISLSTRYSLVYGSLASIIILMLWLYFCSNIIIIGGIINRISNQYTRHLRPSIRYHKRMTVKK